MKQFHLILITILLLTVACKKKEAQAQQSSWYPATNAQGDPVFAVFENHLPCADCNRLKFAIVLYKHPQKDTPSTYMIARVFVGKGDDRPTNSGTVTITRGTKQDATATVYSLDANAPEEFRLFWKMTDDILFVLDKDRNPRVGDAAYGYALNKTR